MGNVRKWHWDHCKNSNLSNVRCEDDVDVCVKSLKSEANAIYLL